MEKRSAAAIDPPHAQAPRFQFLGLKAYVLAASLAAYRDNRSQLVEKDGAAPIIGRDLMGQASLDGLRAVPIQRAQEVRFQPALFDPGSPAPIKHFSTVRHGLVSLGFRSF
jgi:hypothetical protein